MGDCDFMDILSFFCEWMSWLTIGPIRARARTAAAADKKLHFRLIPSVCDWRAATHRSDTRSQRSFNRWMSLGNTKMSRLSGEYWEYVHQGHIGSWLVLWFPQLKRTSRPLADSARTQSQSLSVSVSFFHFHFYSQCISFSLKPDET